MSKSFTTPAGQTWQTLLTELTLAYSERRQAIGQSAYVPEDRDVQPAAYWAGLQSWLEGIVSYGWNPGAFPLSKVFIDHVNGPLTDAGDDFVVYTLDNWRAAAGLHQDGFRRSVDGATFSYGRMQSGDAIGGWIFEDLQKGFGALQMVGDVATAATETKYGYAVTYDCVSALAASLIDWAAKPWRETDAWYNGVYVSAFKYWTEGSYPGHNVQQIRSRSLLSYTHPQFADVPASVACYMHPTSGLPPSYSRLNATFKDLDGYGFSDGILKLWDTSPESNAPVRTFRRIGFFDTIPSVIGGYSCPLTVGTIGVDCDGYLYASQRVLVKWNFTNA